MVNGTLLGLGIPGRAMPSIPGLSSTSFLMASIITFLRTAYHERYGTSALSQIRQELK